MRDVRRLPHAFAGSGLAMVTAGPVAAVMLHGEKLHTPGQLVIAMACVLLVTVVDWLFNRITGRPMPLRSVPPQKQEVHHG